MSCVKIGRELGARIDEEIVAKLVSNALHAEFSNTTSAVKHIARLTGASMDTVGNWYKGKNAPKTVHLIMLAQMYPNIHKLVSSMIGPSAVEAAEEDGDEHEENPIYYDKFVVINVLVDLENHGTLNQRQLWFLGQMQQGLHPKALDIASLWNTDTRTAQRDIAGLVKAELIIFKGARKKGIYKLR